jgi:hypothetical protein
MAKATTKSNKISLNITSTLTEDGVKVPVELKYGDDKFEITNQIRSMKLFDGATRWKCAIDGRQIELFNLGDDWWMKKE